MNLIYNQIEDFVKYFFKNLVFVQMKEYFKPHACVLSLLLKWKQKYFEINFCFNIFIPTNLCKFYLNIKWN